MRPRPPSPRRLLVDRSPRPPSFFGVSDMKRLRTELRILYEAIEQELSLDEPELNRRERRERTRAELLSRVDDAVREVAAEY